MFDIQEELKKLPQKPGVYIMKDAGDKIIYVGKAINLRNRVRQYFQDSAGKMPKVRAMVKNIQEFEYIVTDSEMEALILENNLIKANKPKYNILLKDDKTYPYIKVTVNEQFPKVFIVRTLKKDKAKYFGPYTNAGAIKETLELIHRIWPLRRCSRKLPKELNKERPCLNYHIGQCTAPCNEHITEEAYNKMIDEVLAFLSGKHEPVIKSLENQMAAAAEAMAFEQAAELRDKIAAVKATAQRQRIDFSSGEDQDVIAFARAHNEALVQVFFIRNGKMTGREHFMLSGVDAMTREEVMTAFVQQFYSETTFIPKEIILEAEVEDSGVVAQWLSHLKGGAVHIVVPQKGEKHKLVGLAHKNAILTLEQFGDQIKREKMRTEGALDEIQKALDIDRPLDRIEAYDISNIQGFESVGSMVAFEGGKPKRSDYRKFKIKGVLGPNDYASMEEVIFRRFKRYQTEQQEVRETGASEGKFLKLPDILFIDGGQGQVHSAQKSLEALGMDIPVCGMIKDDRHRTRGLYYEEREILLPVSGEGFKLVTRIQDEVHRFAIEYHRKLRSKAQVRSVLDDIEGIGPSRRRALIMAFGSIDGVKTAEINELAAVEGMNRPSAEAVYNFFRQR